MIKTSFIFGLLLTSTVVFAKNFGLGVVLGNPTGISANYMLGGNKSIDGALAFDLNGDDHFHIHSTYLFRHPKSLELDSVKMGWFWGVGAKFRTHDDRHGDNDYRLGPRGSIGINYIFPKAPVEIFGEIALIMNVIPKTDTDVDAGIGLRYYF